MLPVNQLIDIYIMEQQLSFVGDPQKWANFRQYLFFESIYL